MDLNTIPDALNAGADRIIDAALPVLTTYLLYLVARARTTLLKGVPGWLHALVASAIEQALMPIVINAVKAAEEHGARLAKVGTDRVRDSLSALKLQYARDYVLTRVPDWLVSDARLNNMIDAALVYIGKGATKGITIGVEYVEDRIQSVQPPPAA